jgi:hypothetical protein
VNSECGINKKHKPKVLLDIRCIFLRDIQWYVFAGDNIEDTTPTLMVCLHIDETKWANDQKIERVCLRIMNFACAGEYDSKTKTFEGHKCHGDDSIFTLAHFYVGKENNAELQVRKPLSHFVLTYYLISLNIPMSACCV